jgi:anaerobic selenocysteine-containing dehydrogenase
MGITHHAHGVDNVRMIANLAMLRGMIGRAGAGLLPLRGHSNVQGIGSVGATPALKQAVFDRLQSHFGVQLPTAPGMDTLACVQAAEEGRVRAAIHLGGNLYGSNPDSTFAAAALAKIDLTVFLSTTLNTGHAWGRGRESIILPVLARDEEPQPTTQESMFNFVRLSDGGPRRHDGPRSEVEVIADLAARTFAASNRTTPIDWPALREHRRIREAIAAIVPGFEELASIDDTKKEFHIPGRVFHEPKFPTESGRAKFHVVPMPRFDAAGRTDRLREGNLHPHPSPPPQRGGGSAVPPPIRGEGGSPHSPALPPTGRADSPSLPEGGGKGVGAASESGRPADRAPGSAMRDAEGRHHVAWTRSRLAQPPRDDVEREADRPLRLMTIRSEGQFNTVVYEEEDIYRGQERRDVILLARHDIDRLRLRPDEPVTVRSEAGALANVRVREADIRPGNAAMYYPEANVLVPRVVDPQSRTPGFKSVLVTIERMSADSNLSNGTAFPVGAGTTTAHAPRKNDRAC